MNHPIYKQAKYVFDRMHNINNSIDLLEGRHLGEQVHLPSVGDTIEVIVSTPDKPTKRHKFGILGCNDYVCNVLPMATEGIDYTIQELKDELIRNEGGY